MNPDLTPVVDALADLDHGELAALIDVTNEVPQIAPGLLAWGEHVCDWELNRRGGLEFPLLRLNPFQYRSEVEISGS